MRYCLNHCKDGVIVLQALGNEMKRRSAAEQLWLHYFNQILYDKGLITASERNRMTNRINARKRFEPSG